MLSLEQFNHLRCIIELIDLERAEIAKAQAEAKIRESGIGRGVCVSSPTS